MKFSNPGVFEISNDEFAAQQEQLAELRDAHYKQLVESGAAERIIQSPSYTNQHANKSALTEGSLLYPFRKPIWNLTLMQSHPVYLDAGIPTPGSMLLEDPTLHILGEPETENYVLYIGRHEPQPWGYSTGGYAAGVIFDRLSADLLHRAPRIPFVGIEEVDLVLIETQLAEVAEAAQQKELGIIDPLTLAEGQGQIIGYDDSDF